MNQCIDLTGPKSVARVTLGTMSATGKEAVEAAIGKTLKGQINVKEKVEDLFQLRRRVNNTSPRICGPFHTFFTRTT